MNNSFNCTCSDEKVLSSYKISADGAYILPDTSSKETIYCPFDVSAELVVDYLSIGFMTANGIDAKDEVFEFVSKFGMPERKMKKLDIMDFCQGAEALYMHFSEISAEPYTDSPEWVLETDPASGIITKADDRTYIIWQTAGLLNALELAYTLLLCGDVKQLGLCKHCGKPFYSKNPKSEFCSPQCRNRFNVYKSRNKNRG